MTPTETFWDQVGAYNNATLPVQIMMTVIAMILTYYMFTKPDAKTILMKVFLTFAFAFNGVVFFLIFAKSPISTFLGAPLFIILAVLFAVDIFTEKTEFRLPETKWIKYITICWILLVFLYPLIGSVLGHYYPKTCTPMMPCPLTVFAIAMVTAVIPKVDKKIYVLLLPWALLSLPKCFGVYECYEDCILVAAGVYGLIMLVKNWKVIRKDRREDET